MNTKKETSGKTFEIDLNSKKSSAIDLKQLKKLSDFMKKENLRVLEINGVKLEKYENAASVVMSERLSNSSTDPSKIKGNTREIKSPLIGIYYAAPAPDAPPYVTAGTRVKKGDVICIIEAMKQMNEIVADSDGEIAEVCLRNGEIVEFDQVMFRVM